ncbi:MAG: cation-transporting P-type ATPase [Ruminococcaceae bacterium]|nr:cation-transporting P-type ATPase [Oscillospiraceae bacterium]
MIWHSANLNEVLEELSVDANIGLANGVADQRAQEYGTNEIEENKKISLLKRFLLQFKSKTLIALLIVCIVSFIVSTLYNQPKAYMALVIIGVVVVNAIISAFHLYNCDNTLENVKSQIHPTVKVLREGTQKVITADRLVKGDIIILNEGDYISADARLIESVELRCNESALTGEEVPVEKDSNAVLDDIISFENRSNMVFSGATVVHGTAKAVVVATGFETENGKTTAISEQIGNRQLPIESELDVISKFVNVSILVVCALVFVISLIQNFSSSQPFAITSVNAVLNALALAVAAIPEGLPAIATIVIAIGSGRILQDKIIIKESNAFETVGKTNVIIADKTGIFTHKDMVLTKVYDGKETIDLEDNKNSQAASVILRLGAVCSTLNNDATEKAIKTACLEYNSMTDSDLVNLMPKINQIPFDAVRKSMTVITMINERPVAIVKGAPEVIIPKCINCNQENLLKVNEELADLSLRNVCIAMKPLTEIPANPSADEIEDNLTFVGLLALKEPIRKSAVEEIKLCKKANIKVVMVTGDNLNTAKSVAKEMGILVNDDEAISGAELTEMTDEELSQNIEKYSVFARVSPSDKLRIVKAWQDKKAVVTVTGDSLNDAESLACADVGCAIGKYGTDVAKGNADIIILKNNFGSIVTAIKESRGFFSNIKKAVYYLCSCNLAQLIFMFLGVCIFKLPILAAVQLLLINLLTDCAPAISFSMEQAEQSVMKKKSFKRIRKILDLKSFVSLIIQSLFIALATIVSFSVGKVVSYEVATTMAFATLGITQAIHCFNSKLEGTVFTKEIFSNTFMNKAVFASLFIVIFLVFTPVGFTFGFTILKMSQFLIALGLGVLILPVSELLKYLKTKV